MLLSLQPNVVVGVAAITHADVASVVQTPAASTMLEKNIISEINILFSKQ